jgi:hypothetical protein
VYLGVIPGRIDRPGVNALSDALTAIGITHEDLPYKDGDASSSPAFKAGYIYLVIGHKPQIAAPDTPER